MRRSRRRSTPEVELTPLIDVLFMLIIFFVLSTSFIRNRIVVDLPSGKGTPITESPAIITIDEKGDFFVDGALVTGEEALASAERFNAEGKDILLEGDGSADYGIVASFLDKMRTRGIDKAGLALEGGTSP